MLGREQDCIVPRATIGVIVVDSNTWVTPDLRLALAHTASVYPGYMHLPDPYDAADERAMLIGEPQRATKYLSRHSPDLILFACSSASALLGTEGSARLLAEIEQIAGCSVAGINQLLDKYFVRHAITEFTLVSPYSHAITDSIAKTLTTSTRRVASVSCMNISSNLETALISPQEIADFVLENVDDDVADVYIACGNLRAFEATIIIEATRATRVHTMNFIAASELAILLSQMPPRPSGCGQHIESTHLQTVRDSSHHKFYR